MNGEMTCFCGHDCARCMIYVASRNDDIKLRTEACRLYGEEFDIDLPEEEFRCAGGRSDQVFGPCIECPFRRCCREKGIESCAECADYPCGMLSKYRKKYVNKFGQI